MGPGKDTHASRSDGIYTANMLFFFCWFFVAGFFVFSWRGGGGGGGRGDGVFLGEEEGKGGFGRGVFLGEKGCFFLGGGFFWEREVGGRVFFFWGEGEEFFFLGGGVYFRGRYFYGLFQLQRSGGPWFCCSLAIRSCVVLPWSDPCLSTGDRV